MTQLQDRPEIVGHGGAAAFYDGSTKASIRKALEIGVDRIEIDVQSSSDDKLVLLHDTSLTVGGKKIPVHALSYAELLELYPDTILVEDAYELTTGKCPLMLDLKSRRSTPLVIKAIRSMAPGDDVSASSTHARMLRSLRWEFPRMSLGLSRGHSLTKVRSKRGRRVAGNLVALAQIPDLVGLAEYCGADNVMLNHFICREPLLRVLRHRGLRVNAWTVDRPADIDRMIDLGIDAIISNRPDRVKRHLAHRCREQAISENPLRPVDSA